MVCCAASWRVGRGRGQSGHSRDRPRPGSMANKGGEPMKERGIRPSPSVRPLRRRLPVCGQRAATEAHHWAMHYPKAAETTPEDPHCVTSPRSCRPRRFHGNIWQFRQLSAIDGYTTRVDPSSCTARTRPPSPANLEKAELTRCPTARSQSSKPFSWTDSAGASASRRPRFAPPSKPPRN